MPFIGVISKENDSNFIKNEVQKNSKQNKFEIININKQNIENIKNIRFETLVIDIDLNEFLNKSKYLEEIINNSKYIIINSDINTLKPQKNKEIITYGLNQKAIITISSIKQDSILLYLQKKIEDNNGNIVEEHEAKVEISKNNQKKIYNSMIIYAILTIYGEFLKKI